MWGITTQWIKVYFSLLSCTGCLEKAHEAPSCCSWLESGDFKKGQVLKQELNLGSGKTQHPYPQDSSLTGSSTTSSQKNLIFHFWRGRRYPSSQPIPSPSCCTKTGHLSFRSSNPAGILVPDAEGSLFLSASIPSPVRAHAYTSIQYKGKSLHETCCSCCISAWSDLQEPCEQQVCPALIHSDSSNFAPDCCGHTALGCFEINNRCSGQASCSTPLRVCAVRVWGDVSCWGFYDASQKAPEFSDKII